MMPDALGQARPGPMIVHGGRRLSGAPVTSGFKHSLVTVAAAAAAATAPVRIGNCPRITEARLLAQLIRALGGSATLDDTSLTVDASRLDRAELDPGLAGGIHGAVYLIPALLGRFGRARLSAGGGCQIGDGPAGERPVEHYISVFRRFGARARQSAGGAWEITAGKLAGREIDLLDYAADRDLRSGPLYSGATKMALLTAAIAEGTSVLHHPYPKPDVTDLADVLSALGAGVGRTSAGAIVVDGRGNRVLGRPVTHMLMPDLIEVITWISAAAGPAGVALRILGRDMPRAVAALAPEMDVLDHMGVRLDVGCDAITAYPAQGLRPADVTVASHGVFSDCQPFLALLASYCDGTSRISETVWANRFGYAPGLAALGVRLCHQGRTLTVDGPSRPHRAGQRVHATDLRAAAVLLLAALAVPGATAITGTHHLARGYADLAGALRALGADITSPNGVQACQTTPS